MYILVVSFCNIELFRLEFFSRRPVAPSNVGISQKQQGKISATRIPNVPGEVQMKLNGPSLCTYDYDSPPQIRQRRNSLSFPSPAPSCRLRRCVGLRTNAAAHDQAPKHVVYNLSIAK